MTRTIWYASPSVTPSSGSCSSSGTSSPEHLYEGRDLALTTDFRTVLSEVVYRHLGNRNLSAVFPGFDSNPGSFLKFLA